MENGFQELDNPKALLLPGTLPIPVHSIISRDEDSDSMDNLPSTIDMDALKGLETTDSPFENVLSWRSSPRVKLKPHELVNREQLLLNGLDSRVVQSESSRSAVSNVSSSQPEDSDSDGNDSDSSSNSESTSESSLTSDSDSIDSESLINIPTSKSNPISPINLEDPVLFNAARNSDLTIFPINSAGSNFSSLKSRSHSAPVKLKCDLTIFPIPVSNSNSLKSQTQSTPVQLRWTSTSGNIVITPNSGTLCPQKALRERYSRGAKKDHISSSPLAIANNSTTPTLKGPSQEFSTGKATSGLLLTSPSPILSPMRTKGAKKYIPPEQHQRHVHKFKVSTKTIDDYKIKKRSKSRSKSKKRKRQKIERYRREDRNVTKLYEMFGSQCHLEETPFNRRAERTKTNLRKDPKFFEFSKREFLSPFSTNSAGPTQTMNEFLKEQGFSSSCATESRSNSQFPKLTNGHATTSPLPRKRRNPGCERSSKSNLIKESDVSRVSENSKLQRLPPKKRHMHANTNADKVPRNSDHNQNHSEVEKGGTTLQAPAFGKTSIAQLTFLPTNTSKATPVFRPSMKRSRSPVSAWEDFSDVVKRMKGVIFITSLIPMPLSSEITETAANVSGSFTPSLTERVKIRKRNSTDGISFPIVDKNVLETLTLLGVSPALLNVPDPPIIVPEKSNYLKAGLMSRYYKCEFEPPIVKVECSNEEVAYKKFAGGILPLPVYSRSIVTERRIDFLLPYDIWCTGVLRAKDQYEDWKVEQEVLKAEEKARQRLAARRKSDSAAGKPRKIPMPEFIPDSWSFKKIRSNTYYGLSKPPVTSEPEIDQLCECADGDIKCAGEDCLNRLVFTECPPACGDTCCNRRIQKHDWAPDLKRFLTENKGFGVLTRCPIKKGDFILEYVGEVVSDSVFKERMYTIYANDTHHYCLQLDSGRVIDGHRSGGEGRFVNHSCDPNCEMQKWSVNGLSRMALFALRDIVKGEELSYDYNFSLYNPAEGQPCHCKGVNCRGVIGGRTQYKTDMSAASKRKSGNTKGPHGMGTIVGGRHLEPSVLEKMKILSRKEKNYLVTHHCFLYRNYEKIRRRRDENKFGDRLEKLMSSWILRFKPGSNKNKPISVPDEDQKLSRLAQVAQILYELYANLISAKDENGKCLCESFMEPPSKKRYPNFYTVYETGQNTFKLKGLKALEKGILRGDYETISALELEIGNVINTFSQAYEAEKPDIKEIVVKLKTLYKEGKQKALLALDPFIIQRGPHRLGNAPPPESSLPRFKTIPGYNKDVIRCICGTFYEEGMMVFCEECRVWQHCDCMRWQYDPADAEESMKKARLFQKITNSSKKGPKKNKRNSFRISTLGKITDLDGDEKEKVELDTGIIISVKEELQILEKEDMDGSAILNDRLDNDIPFSELETQVLDVTYKDCADLAEAVEVRKGLDYYCEKCRPREVNPEVPMGGTGDIPGRTYYLTLLRDDGLLVKKNDTVYVLREWPDAEKIGPDGKPHPRKTYKTAGKVLKTECDIFRIQDLFIDANGEKMVFGYNYLRPYETYHEPSRRFYPNEILKAPIVEMVSIDLIHAICWVVDAQTYCRGRPKGCMEEDLYICDLRVDKGARLFSKAPKNSQTICDKPFAFDYFETKLKIQRNLHPHGPPSPDFKLKSVTSQNNNEKFRARKTEEKAKYKNILTPAKLQQDAKKRSEQRDRLNRVSEALHSRIEDFSIDKVDLSHLLTSTVRKKPTWNKKLSL